MPRIPLPTAKQVILYSALLTVLIEGVTVLLRFGLRWESSRDTASTVGRLTGGIRIHHGYIGVLLLVIAAFGGHRWPALSRWLLVIALSLVLSDLCHHFLVLWPVQGDPQFDLVYP